MKILFVYPSIASIGFNSYKNSNLSGDAVPLGISYLASAVELAGFETDIMDLRYLKNFNCVEEIIAGTDAEVLGISVQTPSFEYAEQIARIAKKYNKVVIAGGIHATVLPEDFLNTGNFNYVITGEGEISLIELLKVIASGRTTKQIIKGKDVDDMDKFPRAKDFYLYRKRYSDVNTIEFGRGCPAKCTYCISGEDKLFGRKIKQRSINSILREIEFYKQKYDFYNLAIEDVNATTKKINFINFCELLASRHSKIRVTISTRVDCFDEDIAKALHLFSEAIVWFGFESMSPRLMKFLRKGVNIKRNYNVVELCKKYKIDVGANVLLGVPTETEDDIKITYNFIKDIKPRQMYFNVLSPFPGTEIARYCETHNLLEPIDSYERYEITQVLKYGIIKGVDYDRVRAWQPYFMSCALSYDPLDVGKAFERNKEYDRALKEYKKSFRKSYSPVASLYYMASLFKRMEHYEEALNHFAEMDNFGFDSNKENYFAKRHFHRGEIYYKKGEMRKAKDDFEKCIDLMPSHKMAQNYLNERLSS